MSAPPSNVTGPAIPPNPLGLLPKLPSLNNTFGAFLLATFFGLIMYGLTLHQSYRYFRLFPRDAPILRAIVTTTVVLETLHIVLCMHVCYYYLVTHYLQPQDLLDGVWSIRVLPVVTALVIIVSEGFFTRRVYLIGSEYRLIVVVVPFLMAVIVGFAAAATAEAFILPTFSDFEKVAWMTSAAFGVAVVVDSLLTGTLILTLHRSRTGFKKTDSLIDLLIIYAINTGLITGIFSLLSFIFALIAPNKLIYSAFNIIAAKSYANSLLAVLNSRKGLMDKVQEDCFGTGMFSLSTLQRTGDSGPTTKNSAAALTWNVPRLSGTNPAKNEEDSAGTVLEIRIQKERVEHGDEESMSDTAHRDLESK